MKNIFLLTVFLTTVLLQVGCGQQKKSEFQAADDQGINNIRAFYIGHSLSNPIVGRVHSLAHHHEKAEFSIRYQTNPGSSLQQSWEIRNEGYAAIEPYYAGYYDTRYGLPAGGSDVLVLTESVPRHLGEGIGRTYQYADSLYRFAVEYNPDIQVYLYEIWHCIYSGTPTGCYYDIDANPWRQRLDDDLPMWESVVDTLNSRFNPAKPVKLIPGGQGMAALYDAVMAGDLPGVSTLEDLFIDDIHISGISAYLVACIHFATIYGESPVGLPNVLTDMWGNPYKDNPTPEQAAILQEIAWKVVSEYTPDPL